MKKLFNFVLTLLISFNFIFGGSVVFARSTRRARGSRINARRNIGKRISKATGGQPVSKDINDHTQTEQDPPKKQEPGGCSEKEQKLANNIVERFRFKTSEKVIFGQSVILSNLLTPETYEVYNEKGSNTACLNEYVCFGPYMSVMGRGGDNISKKVDDGIECFAYKPNSYYTFNIFNASDTDVEKVLKTHPRGDLASGNNRVLYIDQKRSGTGQSQDFMHLQTQGYIDFTQHNNNIKAAVDEVKVKCNTQFINDGKHSIEKLYALLVSASVAEGLATGLSAASMAMSAASSAKTGEITDGLNYLNTHETKKPQSKIELLQELAKAKLVRMVATIANYLNKYGSPDLFNTMETYINNDLNTSNLKSVINDTSSWKNQITEPKEEVAGYNALQGDDYQNLQKTQNLLNNFKAKMKEIQNIKVTHLTDEKIDTLSESIKEFKGILDTQQNLKNALNDLKNALNDLKNALNDFNNVISILSEDEKKLWNEGKTWDGSKDIQAKNKTLGEKLRETQSKVKDVLKSSGTVEQQINKDLQQAKQTVNSNSEIKEAQTLLEYKGKLKVIIEKGREALENITCDNCIEPTTQNEQKEKQVIDTLNNFIKEIQTKQNTFLSDVKSVGACDNCSYTAIDSLISQYQRDVNNTDSANKDVETFNNRLTKRENNVKSMLSSTRGLDIGSAVTSAFATAGGVTGMGTSIAAAIRVKTTIERWKACKTELNNLQLTYNKYKTYRDEVFPESTSKEKKKSLDVVEPHTPKIESILEKCNLPDAEKTLNKVRAETIGTSATATVGTVTSLGATIASSMAAEKARKTKGHLEKKDTNKYDNAKKEAEGLKAARTAGAVLAGVGTAAAGVATGLSAASSVKLEKLKDDANLCVNALNDLEMKPLAKPKSNNTTTGEENQQVASHKTQPTPPKKQEPGGGISEDIHNATNGKPGDKKEDDKKDEGKEGDKPKDGGTEGNNSGDNSGNKPEGNK